MTMNNISTSGGLNNDGIRNNYNLKFHGYAIISYTFDYWSNKKHNAGYSLLSESHSISLLDFKTPHLKHLI